MRDVQHASRTSQEQHRSINTHTFTDPAFETGSTAEGGPDHGHRLRHSMMSQPPPAFPSSGASTDALALSFGHYSLDADRSMTAPHSLYTTSPSKGEILRDEPFARKPTHSQRPKVSFEDLASQIHLQQYHEERLRFLEQRQDSLQTAVALSARLHRTGTSIQDGLVDISRRGDKTSFVQTYHTIRELKDDLYAYWNQNVHLSNPLVKQAIQGQYNVPDTRSLGFKLTERSRAALSELLHLLRTNPSFLVERFKSLSPQQLSALDVFPKYRNIQGPSLSSSSRARQTSQLKRNSVFSNALNDYSRSLERSDATSFLLFNVYSVSQGPDSAEALLRLDVWSSVCAQLFVESEDDYRHLFSGVLRAFASLYEWRAKQRLELFLMDLLQKGAFLLELVDSLSSPQDGTRIYSDPLATPDAQHFFDDAVHDLFEILSDEDGGLPYGALHFGSAVLGKLDSDHQDRFRGFVLFTWFFNEFLPDSISCPETQGMLLNSHVSTSARDKILFPVWRRAWAKVEDIYLPTQSQYSLPRPEDSRVRFHVETMIGKLDVITIPEQNCDNGYLESGGIHHDSPSVVLVLAAQDVANALDMLFPKAAQATKDFDPFLYASATAFAAAEQSRAQTGLTPSSRIVWDEGQSLPPFGARTPTLNTSYDFPFNKPRTASYTTFRQFEQLQRELSTIIEQGHGLHSDQECGEYWSLIKVKPGELMSMMNNRSSERSRPGQTRDSDLSPDTSIGIRLDAVQRAAMRLTQQHRDFVASPGSNSSAGMSHLGAVSLERLFEAEIDFAQSRADTTDFHYWWNALKSLRRHYPLTLSSQDDSKIINRQYPFALMSQDDSRILYPIVMASQAAQARAQKSSMDLETNFIQLQTMFTQLKAAIEASFNRLERLRDKLWYMTDVAHSDVYDTAKNIARALNNMVTDKTSSPQQRPASLRGRVQVRSAMGSLLEQPHAEMVGVMKASSEHGGPRKLADEQVKSTKKWLERNAVDNFCKGEERIHRFCMEIKLAAKKLVAETLNESPVLWSSDLYQKERTLFDNPAPKISTSANITRAPSIMTDDFPATYSNPQYGQRAMESGFRPHPLETQSSPGRKSSFHSSGSSRFTRELYANDASSVGGSPGRAVSATTTESISSIWSPIVTQAPSMTSFSSHSRPASTYNDSMSTKTVDQMAQAKARFLENLRQSLVSLLLSDLGCPVWSCGSETDAWLEVVMRQNRVRHRLEKRSSLERLLSMNPNTRNSKPPLSKSSRIARRERSASANPALAKSKRNSGSSTAAGMDGRATTPDTALQNPRPPLPDRFSYADAYADVTDKFCRQISPVLKLEALHELKSLAIFDMKERRYASYLEKSRPTVDRPQGTSVLSSRRSSLNPQMLSKSQHGSKTLPEPGSEDSPPELLDEPLSEGDIVQYLKHILMDTKPRTLFRDLQYISAFVPSESLGMTGKGQAFYHVGLAALEFKDDVCRSLVDIADRIVTADSVKRRVGSSVTDVNPLSDAAHFLTLAAREGNPVAQRELASLYLTHPGILQPVSLPMTLPRETFRPEMMYYRGAKASSEPKAQAMCLALHWMQHASLNGDEVARRKLEERDGSNSIR